MISTYLQIFARAALTSLAQPIIQPQALETRPLFSWGKDCKIELVVDALDFDVDAKTGEKYHVIDSVLYNCPLARAATFDFKPSDDIKRTTTVQKEVQVGFSILLLSRVTEENLGWNL